MYFYENELKAIVKMAKTMIAADGRLDAAEIVMLATELTKLSRFDNEKILEAADVMEPAEALRILKGLTTDEKKYVCGYLAAISKADGDVSSKEVAVWQLVSTLAAFPSMTFAEAIKFWAEH